MSLWLEGGLVLLALVLSVRSRRRGATVTAALALGWLAVVGYAPVPNWLLDHLQQAYPASPPEPWLGRNAIVLLGAGTTVPPKEAAEPVLASYGRIAHAAALYDDCHRTGNDCRVLVSGGDPQHHGASEADVYAAMLRAMGVPASDLIIERRSHSTWQNAQFSRPLLQAYAPQRLVMVSSALHLRRGLLYFAHFGLHPQAVRGDYVGAMHGWLPLAANAMLFDAAVHEYVGVARYHVYNALGWNPPPSPMLRLAPAAPGATSE